jgi:hypothetical protein
VRRLAAVCAAFVLAVGELTAQGISWTAEDQGRQICGVQVEPYFGSVLGWGLGFVRIDLVGLDNRAHRVTVELASPDWMTHNVAARRSFALGPGERARAFLPLPVTAAPNFLVDLRVDGLQMRQMISDSAAGGLRGLLLAERSDRVPPAMAAATRLAGGSGVAPEIQSCAPGDAPSDWRLYTGFDFVAVDGRGRIDGDRQEALRRFVHAGGRVLLAAPDALPPGALRQLGERAAAGDAGIAHGLGSLVALDAEFGGRASAARMSWLLDRSHELPIALGAEQSMRIPGLGAAPVRVFLVVILAFAVVAGPLNFWWLRRRKQPLWALVTVPALGFGTAALMLGFVVLRDGFDLRGVERSWSLLDQPRHEAAAIACRTLFSGASAADYAPGADEMVLAPSAQRRGDQRSPHRWEFDGDTGTIDGAIVPSREITPLLAVTQGTRRERARVRSLDGGKALELLAEGFAPVGEVLLRDREGRFWLGAANRLEPTSDAQARTFARRFALAGATTEFGEPPDSEQGRLPFVDTLARGGELPVGSYLTLIAGAPWLPTALVPTDADAAAAKHCLLGLLAEEDYLQ